MSDRVVHGDFAAAQEIANAIPMKFNAASDRCIHREIDGVVAGGIIYSDWTGESVVMSVAGFGDGWLSRHLLWASFDYPFTQLRVNRVFSQIPETNLLSLGFNAKLGFKPVAYIPGVYRHNVAMVVTCLERADCRWLRLGSRYQTKDDDHG